MEPEPIIYSIERIPDLFDYEEYEITFQKGNTKIPRAYTLRDVDSIRAYILRDYKNNMNSEQGTRPLRINLNGLAEREDFAGLEEWVRKEADKPRNRKC